MAERPKRRHTKKSSLSITGKRRKMAVQEDDSSDEDVASGKAGEQKEAAKGEHEVPLQQEEFQNTCPVSASVQFFGQSHCNIVTCAVVSPDGKTAFSAAKDGRIIKWCLKELRKVDIVTGMRQFYGELKTVSVLAIAISSDGSVLVTGDSCRRRENWISIWKPDNLVLLAMLNGHHKEVTGLAFCIKKPQYLYSTSFDGTLKFWNVNKKKYEKMLSKDCGCLMAVVSLVDQTVTFGMDGHVCLHKIEESTVQIKGNTNCESVARVNPYDSTFVTGYGGKSKTVPYAYPPGHGENAEEVTGSNSNCLSLWRADKDAIFPLAKTQLENSITAVACAKDMIASGSRDGLIKFWNSNLTLLFEVQLTLSGFVNTLEFLPQGDVLGGLATEPRLGQSTDNEATNSMFLVNLPKKH